MPIPQIAQNDVIEIYQWRNDTTFFGVVESEIMTDEEDPYVCYKAVPTVGSMTDTEDDGLYHHNAVWDEEDQRWEDGDI